MIEQSVGTLIWIACRPLLRLVFCVACGIIVTKADIFPPVATRSAGQIIVNIAYPCLMFSKIVPAFTADNLRALGPLVLVAFLYQFIGALLALFVKTFFWVPHRFRYGIIVAGAFGNVGDLPTAVVLSVALAPPFSGVNDQNLGVAYVSTFVLVFVVSLFPFGAHKLLQWDFAGPDVEPEEVQANMRRKRRTMFRSLRRNKETAAAANDVIQERITAEDVEKKGREQVVVEDLSRQDPSSGIYSSHSQDHTATATAVEKHTSLAKDGNLPTHLCGPSNSQSQQHRRRITRRSILNFIKSFFSPPSISIFVSFPIALIPKVKALFVAGTGTYMPSAPDGQPPLAFVMDAASFVGNAAVPLALICLGSSLARLSIPKRGEWRNLPLGAIMSLAAGKLLLMPVLGVLICQGLTHVGVISKDDIVLRFVCIFCSCLPTATTQVFLTQVYSGTGSAEHISVFLIPQYFLMFITMTALTAYTLQLLS